MIKRTAAGILKFIPTSRIKTVSRICLDREMLPLFKKIKPGVVLDIGSGYSPYKKYIPYSIYLRFDSDKESKPDICGDIHDIKWESDYFDFILVTEVLEHLFEPRKAVDEVYRILKPGGTCIFSTRFIHHYHPHPKDYYRFTWDSLDYLFKEFRYLEIFHYGNRIQLLWQIINSGKTRKYFGFLLNIFNPLIARISFKNRNYPLGFVISAQK